MRVEWEPPLVGAGDPHAGGLHGGADRRGLLLGEIASGSAADPLARPLLHHFDAAAERCREKP